MAVIPASTPVATTTPVRRSAPFPLLADSILWPLCAIVLCGAGLRFYHLAHLSLWNDEAFSRFYYQTGLRFMWTEGLHRESSPPLYYMALGGWIQLLGGSETALRALSAVASTLAIPLVYVLGRELLDHRHGLFAAALFALSPTAIYYAQEARPYGLLLLPVLVTLIACARALRAPGGIANLALYVIGATASIYTHTTMFLFVAACGVAVLAWSWASRPGSGRRFVAAWIAANAVVAVLALPALIGMTSPAQLRQLAWIPPLNLRDGGAVISNTVVGTRTPGRFPGALLAILVAGVLAVSIWRDRLAARATVIVLMIPGLYASLVLLLSATVQPIMLGRIFSWTVVGLCLLEARALLARGWPRPVAIGAIVATACVGLSYQLAVPADAKEPWREVVQSAAGELDKADLVVLAPDTDPAAVMYYAPELTRVAMWSSEPMTPSQLGIMPKLFGISGITRDEIVRRITSGSRLTLIARASDDIAVGGLLGQVRPPRNRLDRRCVGGDGNPTHYPCGIAILSWDQPAAIASPTASATD